MESRKCEGWMNYAAEVIKAGENPGEWVVAPLIVEMDGGDAPNRTAFSADAIKPAIGDFVFCIESHTDYEFNPAQRVNDPTGANVIIVGVFADILSRDATLKILKDLYVTGRATLGTGAVKMVLVEALAVWAQKVDAALTALYAWGATGVAPGPTGGIVPFPGTPAAPVWVSGTNLSQNHKLD